MTRVMIDLEGTLSDHTDRLATLQKETFTNSRDSEAWKKYYKGLPNDQPRENMVQAVRKWIEEGVQVTVYSTRFQNKYKHEEAWLRTHGLFEQVELLQRDAHTERTVKGPRLTALWAVELEPSVLVDDRDEVRHEVKLALPGTIVLGPEDFA